MGRSSFQITRVVMILIAATTAGHILFRAFFPSVAHFLHLYLVPDDVLHHGYVWQLATHLFMEPDVIFLLFNMIGLYFIGPIVEGALGTRRFVLFYFLCGLGGALSVIFYALYSGNYEFGYASSVAAIDGCCIAFAMIDPDMQVLFGFFIPMRAKWLGVLIAAITLISGLEGSMSLPFVFAGMGGMLTAYLYWKFLRNLGEGTARAPRRAVQPLKRPNLRVVPSPRQLEIDEPAATGPSPQEVRRQQQVDAVLDKIRVSGMGSLTPDELRILGDASRNLRNER